MAYTRVNWEDLPSTNTPRNATNLNNMDAGIKENDDRLNGTKPMGSIVVDDVKCKNSLNPYTFINGNISSTGEYQLNQVNYLSDYIEVKPNTKYIASANTAQAFFQISEWTENKTFIQRTALTNTATNTITTTSTTKYVRVSYNKDNVTTMTQEILLGFEPQFELGEERTIYTPHKNFENEEVYSGNEIKIGTWIDRKPLYRKVFTITSLTSSNTNLVDISGLSIDFAKISGTIITSTGAKFPINLYDNATNYTVIFLSDTGYIRGRGAIGSGTLSKCIVILEYTKTTSGTRMLSVVNEGDGEDR